MNQEAKFIVKIVFGVVLLFVFIVSFGLFLDTLPKTKTVQDDMICIKGHDNPRETNSAEFICEEWRPKDTVVDNKQ